MITEVERAAAGSVLSEAVRDYLETPEATAMIRRALAEMMAPGPDERPSSYGQ